MKWFLKIRHSAVLSWSLAGLLALAICFMAVSVPGVSAQPAAQDPAPQAEEMPAQASQAAQAARPGPEDARRYSQLLQNIYQFVLQNYVDEMDPAVLYEGAMKGMFEALGDPHSIFLDEPMLSDLMRETDGTYAGVGLYISKPFAAEGSKTPSEVLVEVVSPIEDTPAWKAGVLPGDLIVKIDGKSTADLSVDEASALIRGPEGTKVTMIFRRGGSYEFELVFERAVIEIPAIKVGVIEQDGARIGYLRIIEWIPQTAERIRGALDEIMKAKADYLIVDVRSNPGGLLSSVIDVSNLFMDSGTIVSTRGRNSRENYEYKADRSLALPKRVRMIVLVNQGSASASEIFAGAMKDTRRALLLGEKTYGKGSVQQVFPLDSTGFKLTMSRYYTPSGVNIDKSGIEPDISVPDFTFSDAQLESLKKLYEANLVQEFAKANPDASIEARKARAKQILAEGYDLPLEYVDRLLRDELERTKTAPIYDLEFDVQLNKAIETILGAEFDTLLKNSKTLSQALAPL